MSRIYSVEFEGVAVTAAVDLFEIAPADDKPCAVHAMFLAQSSDVGDASEEILRYRVIRGHSTTGSGGASATPVPLDPSDTAAGFTAETNNTTIATAGTAVNVHSGAFNIRSGEPLVLPPEMRWKVNQAQGLLVVRLMAAPTDSLTMSGTLYVEEL